MTLPWPAAIGVEYAVFRRFFRSDLAAPPEHKPQAGQPAPVPRFTAGVLAVAAVAAVLANLINKLPAVLALLPVAAAGGAGPVLAVLIGVHTGPNLTYAGSLATLLWRRSCTRTGTRTSRSGTSPGSAC